MFEIYSGGRPTIVCSALRSTMKKKIKGKINLSFEFELPKELKILSVSIEKVWSEMKEHIPFAFWIFKRIIIPTIPILIIANFLLKVELLPIILVSIIPFLYGNFLPDFDSLMKYSKTKSSSLSRKLFLLLFGPVYIYYFVFEKSEQIYTKKKKEFHSLKYLLLYFLFLFVLSFLIFSSDDLYKHIVFSVLGSLGYAIHLFIDGRLFPRKMGNRKS
jgi:hypothetical protein